MLEAVKMAGKSELCISLSSNPGNLGMTVHSAGYKARGLDFKYLACSEDNIKRAMLQMKTFDIRGASISMPFKVEVLDYLDWIDDSAVKIGAVNTVVNRNGKLYGYNTDLIGFSKLLDVADVKLGDKIHVFGSGGAARAVLECLSAYSDVSVWVRGRIKDPSKDSFIEEKWNRETHDELWAEDIYGTMINCTPVGMNGELLGIELLRTHKLLDLGVNDSPTVITARKLGIPAFNGSIMALYGAMEQFGLYTGTPAPVNAMTEAFNERQAQALRP